MPETDKVETLFETRLIPLLKNQGIEESGAKAWAFAGIASDEKKDEQGDELLKQVLDLSYASDRGYVNWDHSSEPDDQLGYLTKAAFIDKENRAEIQQIIGKPLSKTASIYVEGKLYSEMTHAKTVRDIMRSTEDIDRGLGLSIEGSLVFGADYRKIEKVLVRGVAITPSPANKRTLVGLMKSLRDQGTPETTKKTTDFATDSLSNLVNPNTEAVKSYTLDEAAFEVLKAQPNMTFNQAVELLQQHLTANSEASKNV